MCCPLSSETSPPPSFLLFSSFCNSTPIRLYVAMLKRKLFPDRLGNLVAAKSDDKHHPDPKGGLDSVLESGEELQELHDAVAVEVEEQEEEKLGGGADEEQIIRQGSGQVPVSASDVIAAEEKRSDLQYELSQQEINLEKLQRIASKGLPDGGGLRATIWKLLLGYLPPSRDEWEKELSENRLKYVKLKDELLSSPSEFSSPKVEDLPINTKGQLQRHKISPEDHPLSVGKTSPWNQFFQYTEIVEQIDRDLQRTHPDLRFFSGETSNSRKHRQAMKNILLLFAKLNPVIGYVQGMNEVLAPLYFVFTTDTNERNAANAEADSFSCFVRLLSDSIDHFCQELDNSSVGILSTISRLSDLLRANDEELWRHLELTTKVEPQFYGFRWITLLLTQEFDFQTILRIWDSLLGNQFGVQDMLLRVCCAMLLCVKSKLMTGDFIANLKLLQHYPVDDVGIEHLLQVATDLSPDTSSYRLSL